jgi:hypothetical protein
MSSDLEIERALAAITTTLNDQQMERFETARVQKIVTRAPGGERALTIDDGGGLHDTSGARVGAVRRTDGGEWIIERRNDTADRSDTAVPAKPQEDTPPRSYAS